MNFFSKLGGNLIEDRIKTEAQKLIDEKATSAFLNSLFPAPDGKNGVKVRLKATLELSIERALISYTQHTGKDESHSTALTPQKKEITLDTAFFLAKSFAQPGKKINLEMNDASIAFAGILSGIDFTQMFFGMGATIQGIDFKVNIQGKVSCTEE